MKAHIFAYIAVNFVLLHLVSLQNALLDQVIYVLCTLGILTLGIAHGAIDNILYGTKPGKSNMQFIGKYVIVIFLFAALWTLLPNLAFIIFLIASAYHFGQSQLTDYVQKSSVTSKLLFLSWGSIVILLLFHFNSHSFLGLQEGHSQVSATTNHLIQNSGYYLLGSGTLCATAFLYTIKKNQLNIQVLFKELYVLTLITFSMYLFPPFIAFSLFFVFIHSFRVVLQEFDYCQESLEIKSLGQFVKLFLPLTTVSVIGTIAVILLVYGLGKTEIIPYVLLILLSCLTIPHALVMDRFYKFASNLSKI